MRASVVGSGRTAEELGRAFPGFPVRTSGGDRVLAEIEPHAAVVVATPGAEPICPGGYGAALLLDGWALLSRPDLRAAEETLRRWANATALVRAGGTVVVGAEAGVAAVQALVRFDPVGFAVRELAERRELGFPPASRMAALTGPPAALTELLAGASLPPHTEVIGPVPTGDDLQRYLVRSDRVHGAALARALRTAAAGRSARRSAEPVRIVLDPLDAI